MSKRRSSQKTPDDKIKKGKSTPASQQTIEESFSQASTSQNLNEFVKNCVRYFVFKAGENSYIRKADLQKSVLHGVGRNFDVVIKKTENILRNIYGLTIATSDLSASNRVYFVLNYLQFDENLYVEEIVDLDETSADGNEYPRDVDKSLKLLILAHIFMSKNCSNEASLRSFLEHFGIDFERNHYIFGNIKEYINNLVKQKYLVMEMDNASKKTNYVWGARAECEISKQKILNFVCKMYGNCQPKSFAAQLEHANSQTLLTQNESMEVEP